MSIDNRFKKESNYTSTYRFDYQFRESTNVNKYHRYAITTIHRWKRSKLNNLFTYNVEESRDNYYAETSYDYHNEFKIKKQPVPYYVGFTGDYMETEGGDAWWNASGYIRMFADKSKRLMPGLTATSRIRANYWRKQNKSGEGVDIYNVGFNDRIVSRQLRNITVYGTFSSSYSESGVPVRAATRAVYKKSNKLILYTGVDFNTFFRQEHRGLTYNYKIYFGGNYQIRANLKYNGEISYTNESTEDGISYGYDITVIESDISWFINSRSNFEANGRYEFGNGYRYLYLYAQYRNRIHSRGSIYVGLGVTKRETTDAVKQLTVGYNMAYRKLSFNATYRLKMWGGGSSDHKLTLKVSRTFGRTFSRLW